jgi:hypothetical protein
VSHLTTDCTVSPADVSRSVNGIDTRFWRPIGIGTFRSFLAFNAISLIQYNVQGFDELLEVS